MFGWPILGFMVIDELHRMRRRYLLGGFSRCMYELRGGSVLDGDGPRDIGMLELRGGAVLDGNGPRDLGMLELRSGAVL